MNQKAGYLKRAIKLTKLLIKPDKKTNQQQKTQKTQMTSIRNKIGITINDPMIIIEMIKKYDEQIPWLA